MGADIRADDAVTGQFGQLAWIEITGAGKRYGDLQVFQDINLKFSEGVIATVSGPLGCGKTTLLRCIDGPLFELTMNWIMRQYFFGANATAGASNARR
jgi:ABC-type transporter Mla maintaining outer membrane lipid asymmetry ATPase subunit MlaF